MRIVLFLITFFWSNLTFSQKVAIEQVSKPALKFGTRNYVRIIAEGISCDSIIIKSNAVVEKDDDCMWNIKPLYYDSIPEVILSIFQMKENDTLFIDKRFYYLEKIDPLILQVGRFYSEDTISVNELIQEKGIFSFAYKGEYGCVTSIPTSFKCLLLSGSKVKDFKINIGHYFTNEIVEFFKLAKPGDIIYFFDFEYTENEIHSRYKKSPEFKLYIK